LGCKRGSGRGKKRKPPCTRITIQPVQQAPGKGVGKKQGKNRNEPKTELTQCVKRVSHDAGGTASERDSRRKTVQAQILPQGVTGKRKRTAVGKKKKKPNHQRDDQ